jgi:glycosyltransferase involved in cell wall biosynthesis
MILGYDATTLAGPMTGVGYYTRRLLEGLIAGRARHGLERIEVLSNRPLALGAEPGVQVRVESRLRFRSLWMMLELPRLLRRLPVDVVHFTNYLAPLTGDLRYVVSVHDLTLLLFPHLHTVRKRLLTAGLVSRVARRARLVLTPSESSRRDAVTLLGLDPGRVRMIPYAPPDHFRPADEGPERLAAFGVRPPYLLHVGTLEPRKNLPRALRAFARVADAVPDASFVVAGGAGWDGGAARREAARARGLLGRVNFLGYVREELLPLLYTHAAALVYPSLYEGFGFPVIEAMACGAPVLTSRSSSLAEIAEGAAWLVDPLDERALGEAMVALLADQARRDELRAKGRARVSAYTWERTVRETVAAYREAAGR